MTMFRKHTRPTLVLALVIASGLLHAACSSSDSGDHLPPISTNGGTAGAGGSATNAGSTSGTNDAGSSGAEAGAADGGATNAGAGGTMPPGPALCSDTATWKNPKNLAGVSSDGSERLLAITADELDVAFLRAETLYVAHRASVSGSFDLGSAVSLPSGWTAAEGAALSADGLRLILVNSTQKELGELTRVSRDGEFPSTIDETAFSALNTDAIYTGKLYAAPALSPTDQQLFLSSSFKMGSSDIVVSLRTGNGVWPAPLQLGEGLFDGDYQTRRLPSGVSADERTLFYFNEASQKEEARFRSSPALTSPFYELVDLGTLKSAVPNAACDRLYSDAAGDIVVDTH